MYYICSVLTGALIAIMIVLNGGLTSQYGIYMANVFIHAVGLVFVFLMILNKRERICPDRGLPFYYYLGGVIGVATVTFNNLAFSRISVSAILALSLLGQSVTSIVIDQFGLFGMQRIGFNKKKLIGTAFVILGIVLIIVV